MLSIHQQTASISTPDLMAVCSTLQDQWRSKTLGGPWTRISRGPWALLCKRLTFIFCSGKPNKCNIAGPLSARGPWTSSTLTTLLLRPCPSLVCSTLFYVVQINSFRCYSNENKKEKNIKSTNIIYFYSTD